MKKRYVLYTRTKSKYEDFYRYHFKIFNDYFELQKHLMHYWYINKNDYTIFEETNLVKDYSLNDIKRGIR
jgi:hypothetical protein